MAVFVFGYARVSTKEQNVDRQVEKFRSLGIDEKRIFTDKESGKNFDRADYQKMRGQVREGDLIYFDALDRLGRDYDGIIAEWKYFTREIGADIIVLENESLFDSRKYRPEVNAMGRVIEDVILSLLAYVAEQERKKLLQRQKEGIAVARRKGIKFGRKKIEGDERFVALYRSVKAGDLPATKAWESLGMKKATWYRRVKEFEETLHVFSQPIWEANMKFQGMYEYLGFAITNNGPAHEWDVEPLGWEIPRLERFKAKSPCFKTLAQARKWIKAEGQQILKIEKETEQ